jgi:hypothetical protein
MKNGVDVEPTDRIIYVDDPSKSLEYGRDETGTPGDTDQVMMVFRWDDLQRAVSPVRRPIPQDQLDKLRAMYRTEVEQNEWVLFSNASREELSRAGTYMEQYGAFIPGDPWKSLLMLILIGDDIERLIGALQRCASGITSES